MSRVRTGTYPCRVYKYLYRTIEIKVEKGGKGYSMGRWKEIGFKINKRQLHFLFLLFKLNMLNMKPFHTTEIL